ncbi:MAG: hypothetical protein ABL957_01960 [Parvularculaceae bacterium]
MSLSFLVGALAALSAATAQGAIEDGAAIVQAAPETAKSSRILLAVAAAAAAVAVAEDSGETLEIYPLQFRSERAGGGPQFQLGGVGLSFAAYRSKVPSDPLGLVNFRSESRAMGRFMPGYPQPAKVVVGLKVSF